MDRESVKWLLIGLGGAATMFLLMAGAALFLFSISEEVYFDDQATYSEPTQSGMEKRAECEAEYFRQLEEFGLKDRYTIITAHSEWRAVLYEQGDFEAVEEH